MQKLKEELKTLSLVLFLCRGSAFESFLAVTLHRTEDDVMPMKPKHPCRHPGCPNLTDRQYCDTHEPLHRGDRESSSRRGYDRKWQKARKRFLSAHPLCAECMRKNPPKYVKATVVDHIVPHRGNPVLFWDEGNWQPLCKPCHDNKTWNEDKNPTYNF